jgi:hypothetical protein
MYRIALCAGAVLSACIITATPAAADDRETCSRGWGGEEAIAA